jgi:hypothetical protein
MTLLVLLCGSLQKKVCFFELGHYTFEDITASNSSMEEPPFGTQYRRLDVAFDPTYPYTAIITFVLLQHDPCMSRCSSTNIGASFLISGITSTDI